LIFNTYNAGVMDTYVEWKEFGQKSCTINLFKYPFFLIRFDHYYEINGADLSNIFQKIRQNAMIDNKSGAIPYDLLTLALALALALV
jgi:hypothetical protein